MGRGRFTVLIVAIAGGYGLLFWQLYTVQIAKGDLYAAKVGLSISANSELSAQRGIIYFSDKHGTLLSAAANKLFTHIIAVPKDIKDPPAAARAVAPILGISAEDLERRLQNENDEYELLATKASERTVRAIDSLGIKGVFSIMRPGRFYPFGSLASHVLGYVGPDDDSPLETGHYGIEGFYDEELTGVPGRVEGTDVILPRAGNDVELTIDPSVQNEAERILKSLVTTHHALGGSVIVANPRNGKLFAAASFPDFDPNAYATAPVRDFLNPIVQEVYEPGSISKVITMAAGIDAGKITPETTYVDKGSLTINGRTIKNYDLASHGPYGKTTMTAVIEHSINTGAVFAEQQIGHALFRDYLEKFGFGEKTGIMLPGEVKGDLRQLNPAARAVAFATASYGQGISMTAIELVRAMSAIANNGVMMQPYLDARLAPQEVRRVISEDAARKVAAMMVSAVDHAGVAQIKGYAIAGKTGTAYVPDFERGGYTENVINTYVGFGPASDPQFLILIKLNEPEGAPVAALTVVPAFRELAEYVINYYMIPPDRIEEE